MSLSFQETYTQISVFSVSAKIMVHISFFLRTLIMSPSFSYNPSYQWQLHIPWRGQYFELSNIKTSGVLLPATCQRTIPKSEHSLQFICHMPESRLTQTSFLPVQCCSNHSELGLWGFYYMKFVILNFFYTFCFLSCSLSVSCVQLTAPDLAVVLICIWNVKTRSSQLSLVKLNYTHTLLIRIINENHSPAPRGCCTRGKFVLLLAEHIPAGL